MPYTIRFTHGQNVTIKMLEVCCKSDVFLSSWRIGWGIQHELLITATEAIFMKTKLQGLARCIRFMWNKPCALLVFSWEQVVRVFITSCVVERAHVQRDNSVIVLLCVVTCSTDAEPMCRVILSFSCRL